MGLDFDDENEMEKVSDIQKMKKANLLGLALHNTQKMQSKMYQKVGG